MLTPYKQATQKAASVNFLTPSFANVCETRVRALVTVGVEQLQESVCARTESPPTIPISLLPTRFLRSCCASQMCISVRSPSLFLSCRAIPLWEWTGEGWVGVGVGEGCGWMGVGEGLCVDGGGGGLWVGGSGGGAVGGWEWGRGCGWVGVGVGEGCVWV